MVQKRQLENGMVAIVDPNFTATPDVRVEIKPNRAAGTVAVLLLGVGAIILTAALLGKKST